MKSSFLKRMKGTGGSGVLSGALTALSCRSGCELCHFTSH